MKTLRAAIYTLCLLIALGPSLALAQSAPATLPYHTVYGRIGATPGDTGPGQAIPFATLKAQMGQQLLSVLDFGADPNAADNAPAIQAAINAAPTQAALFFPPGTYNVLGTGSCAITIGATNKSLKLYGVGFASWIKPAVGFPADRDVICFKPVLGTSGGGVTGMRVGPAFLAPLGRHAIHVDLSDAGNAASVTDFAITNNLITPTAAGRSIYLHSTVTNPTGGVFYSQFENNDVESILTQYIGDGITIAKNIVTGTNAGIDVSQTLGSGGMKILGNVVANTGGCIIVRSGIAPLIGGGNICEQTTTITETNGAIVDITGDIATVVHPQIINSQIQATIGPTGITAAIRLGAASNPLVSGNYLAVQGATKHIVVTASASDTVIGSGNQYWVAGSLTAPAVTDGGTRTTYTYQSTAPNGTSGGMPFFDANGNLKSSALFNGNALVIGGGPGTTPFTGNVATDGQVLVGQTGNPPVFQSITGNVSFTAAGVANLVTTQVGAHTWSNGQTFSAAMTYGGVTLANSVTGTGSMALSISPIFTGNVVVNSSAAGSALAINGTNAAGTQLGLTSASTSIGAFFFFNDGTNTTINGLLNATFGCKTGAWAVYTGACRLTIDQGGNVAIGAAALATTATDGFLYIDSGAGTPTGVPTAFTGRVAIYYDTTNHKICYYDPTTPSWRCSAAM